MLKLLEHKVGAHEDEAKGDQVIPPQLFFENEDGKYTEEGKGNDFLDHLELEGAVAFYLVADAVGGDLEAVFKQGNRPADQDDLGERGLFKPFEVTVPGDGHEDVGTDQQEDGAHRIFFCRRRLPSGV